MKRVAFAAALLVVGSTGLGWAHEGPEEHDHGAPEHDAASEHGAAEHGEHGTAEHAGHGSEGHAAGGHGHHGDHMPTFSDINWFTGLIGEKEGVEPGLLWRAPGTPVPLGALLLNTAVLFYFLGSKGGPAIRQGLLARKQRIAGDIEAARAMKAEAEEQLAHYEGQLAQMEAEMERIKSDMREQAKLERERILADAAVRRETMARDTHLLITQELNAAREAIAQTTASEAVKQARKLIAESLTAQDHDRLAQEQLSGIAKGVQSEVRS